VHNLNHHCFSAYSASTVPTRIVRHAPDKSKTNPVKLVTFCGSLTSLGAVVMSEMLLSAIRKKEYCKFHLRQLD
ncbi:MAG: hypothetical protein M3447_00410, partial [Acidobacteriota bacterium]|nr:hypothetical protein [Acidobacteriota bacterium]